MLIWVGEGLWQLQKREEFFQHHFQLLNSSIHLWLWWIVMGTSRDFHDFPEFRAVFTSQTCHAIRSAEARHVTTDATWCDKTLQEGKLRSPLTAALSWPHSMLLHSGGSGCAKGTQAKMFERQGAAWRRQLSWMGEKPNTNDFVIERFAIGKCAV